MFLCCRRRQRAAAVPDPPADTHQLSTATFNWYYLAASLIEDHNVRARDLREGDDEFRRIQRYRRLREADPHYFHR